MLHHALSTLHDHRPLPAAGYTCTTADLCKVLLGVAVTRGTIESGCADWVGTPDPQTIRGSLTTQLRGEERPELERHLHDAWAAELPPRVRRHAHAVALATQDRPSYGTGEQETELGGRGKAPEGTTRFYRVAPAYLVLNGLRVTVALPFVVPADDTLRGVDRLRSRGKALGIEVACLLLAKGFDGSAVRASRTRHSHPALRAGTIRGTTGGPRARGQGRRSYCTTPTFQGAPGARFTAARAVCRVFTPATRTKRRKRRAEGRRFILSHRARSPRYARQL